MTRDLAGRTKAAFLAEKVFRPDVALVDIATAIFVVLGEIRQPTGVPRDHTTLLRSVEGFLPANWGRDAMLSWRSRFRGLPALSLAEPGLACMIHSR